MHYIWHMWNATFHFESNVETMSNLWLFQSQIRRKLYFYSKLSNLIDSNVAFHMHLILEFNSAHVKCDVWTGPKSWFLTQLLDIQRPAYSFLEKQPEYN